MPEDISRYYVDLKDPDLVTRLALVHQRFSTNTFNRKAKGFNRFEVDSRNDGLRNVCFRRECEVRAGSEILELEVTPSSISLKTISTVRKIAGSQLFIIA